MLIQQVKRDNSIKGIWKYIDLLPKIGENNRITLNEGDTPISIVDGISFKHEYQNPTGSVKDRGICYQFASILSKKISKACISSSGNAGISAAGYANISNIDLTVFVSYKINKKKLEIMKKNKIRIIQSLRPVSDCADFSVKNNVYNLRQSKDPNAVYGFSTIAYEINEKQNDIDAVFFPVSSATTLVGTALGFKKMKKRVAIHAVQTESVHPISANFDSKLYKSKSSIADAIVAKYTARQDQALKFIYDSNGSGWIISDSEIMEADNWLKTHGIYCSFEGALTLAGLFKSRLNGFKYNKPLCLLTGRSYD